jgi:hypothetical protein
MQKLESLPTPPSLHVAVVSSDMGAPGDATSSVMCTKFGNEGKFQSAPQSNSLLNPPVVCTDTTIATPPGAPDSKNTFISDADMMPNFTNPDISKVFQCIALLGDKGCGFENQLGSIDRALGAENLQPGQTPNPPSTNVGFLRPEAYLGIVILTNEDDCSAPPSTQLYSLNGGDQDLANPLGPLANYRCNQFGHICTDPVTGAVGQPPLKPPTDAMMTGTTPTLDLTNCISDDTASGRLTPVTQFINDIKALKTVPDDQILVAAISAPAAPYTVEWLPPKSQPGELWPAVEHSCGAKGGPDVNPEATMNPTDSSFGDPGVRIAQFVNAFKNSVLASICDPNYARSMTAIATKLGQLITPPCITGQIQKDSQGQPMCTVVEHLVDMQNNKKDVALQNCDENGGALPCWTLTTGGTDGGVTCSGSQLNVMDPPGTNNNSEDSTVDCSICLPVPAGSTPLPGC